MSCELVMFSVVCLPFYLIKLGNIWLGNQYLLLLINEHIDLQCKKAGPRKEAFTQGS